MPPELAHRPDAWTAATAAWLAETGARLVVGCRAEYWQHAGAGFPARLLHTPPLTPGGGAAGSRGPAAPSDSGVPLPPCLRLGDLTEEEAGLARSRAGIPPGALAPADARHPLVLGLYAEVRAALPEPPGAPLDRDAVFGAHLDLMCLRVAVRLAAANGLRGTAVRRLAARVSGQVHEAARRSLGPGQGALDRASFEAVFPWGAAPGPRFAGATGWASAVLTEGLLVPAGDGYRFAHEELADWIQGTHLDLDGALHTLVHRARGPLGTGPHTPVTAAEGSGHPGTTATGRRRARRSRPAGAASPGGQDGPQPSPAPPARAALPVPRHRIGPVTETLLLLARQQGPAALSARLEDLVGAVDDLLAPAPAPVDDALWWAGHLCADVLLRVPDATPHTDVLRLLTERIVAWREQGRAVPAAFGPGFWAAVALPPGERFDLLRRLVVTDPRRSAPPGALPAPEPVSGARHLDTVARLLAEDPAAVHPHLVGWFDDERALPSMPHATVAAAAQALLYAHRRHAPDHLAEALVDRAHRRADELLGTLAEEEPSALCRAVDRWAHDDRPARRVAAVVHGLRAAPFAVTGTDRHLLRRAALAVLARPADDPLHGGALGILVRDPVTRDRYLPHALERFAGGDARLSPDTLVAALTTHPEPVFAAFRDRLRRPGPDTADLLRTLADVTTPALARRIAALVREAVEGCPEAAEHIAGYAERSLDHGEGAHLVLFPLVSGLLAGCPEPVRAALARVLAAPDTTASASLRRELLDLLLAREHAPAVLESVLTAAAEGCALRGEEASRALVLRVGRLLVRTPAGATGLDRAVTDLARRVPGFASVTARWLDEAPDDWSGLVGPGTRTTVEHLARSRVPA